MCMKPTHAIAGAYAGAVYGWATGLPWWACVGTGALATITAAGKFSPDMDRYKWWPKSKTGPTRHRGITHFPGVPAIVAAGLYGAPLPAPVAMLAWTLLAGWTSHLALDFLFGKASPWDHRGPGIPLMPWWGHVGLGLDTDGLLEHVFRWALVVAPFAWLAYGVTAA